MSWYCCADPRLTGPPAPGRPLILTGACRLLADAGVTGNVDSSAGPTGWPSRGQVTSNGPSGAGGVCDAGGAAAGICRPGDGVGPAPTGVGTCRPPAGRPPTATTPPATTTTATG